MTFGEKLSKLRKECNYTQEQLADKINVSRQSVSKWESGASLPDIVVLKEMADLFDGIGVKVLNGYGITECAPLIAVNRNKYFRDKSVGRIVPIDEVRINEPDENGEGEIVYDEFPVGIVPESCDAKLEYDEEKDKTYLQICVSNYRFLFIKFK